MSECNYCKDTRRRYDELNGRCNKFIKYQREQYKELERGLYGNMWTNRSNIIWLWATNAVIILILFWKW